MVVGRWILFPWPHYLLGLAPGVALAAGFWAHRLPMRAVAVYVLVAALVSIPLNHEHLTRDDWSPQVGRYVGAAAEPGDTLTTMYGKADLQWAAGMDSPYRHLWGLDAAGQVDPVMVGEYDLLWEGCGTLAWLREGVDRELSADAPDCAD